MNILQRLGRLILPFASLASLAVLGGCGGYHSDYVPLEDGRARAVFRGDRLALEIGGDISPECALAIADTRGTETGAYSRPDTRGRVWVPIYYGPRIVVVHGAFAPVPRRGAYTGASPSLPSIRPSSGGGSSISSSGGGGGSSGGGGDAGKAFVVVLAVAALIALPAISLGLALGRPEPEAEVAEVIDQVNLYNDLARSPGSPCYLYAPPAQAGRAP